MITLLIVVCLAGSCKEEPVAIPEGASCVMNGQELAQDWLREHPKWEFRGWRCRYGEPAGKA